MKNGKRDKTIRRIFQKIQQPTHGIINRGGRNEKIIFYRYNISKHSTTETHIYKHWGLLNIRIKKGGNMYRIKR